MQCPFCKEQRSDKVIDSRATEAGTVIRRRRVCQACNKRYTTYERVEETTKLMVVKKSGNRVPYEREKVLRSLQNACWKRSIGVEALQDIVEEVEEVLFRKFDREVPSSYIGNCLAVRLRKLDKVAYLRFASLYHDFQVVDDFIEEAKAILDRDDKDVAGQQELFNDQ
jgi:transcriptional repressor NrdR